MNDIVPIGAPASARPAAGRVTHINRFDDLRAGSYWRAKDDVPELTKPQQRERGIYLPEDHPDYLKGGGWTQSERNRIGTEKYLVDVPVRAGLPAGRIHLVKSLKLVDGDIHAILLQGHPSEREGTTYTYLVDEFLHFFELVSEEEAQAVRQAEIAALQKEIGDLQQAMIAGPPTEAPVALLGHQAKLPVQPTVGTMIANIGHVETLAATADRALAIAKAQSDWITTHTKEIGTKTAALVPFYQERAAAALAATETVMRYAADLQRGVQSLGLYSGKDVVLKRLAEGESADPAEPLVLHRHMLFMDEEYVVHHDLEGDEGGADVEDFDDFVEQLVKDEKLRMRVLPFPRMVTLMRYRREGKRYFTSDTIEAAIANAQYNEANMVQFLLVRDGDNLFQVWSDLTTQRISALYPTKAMGDAPFRGIDGSQITINDLDYSRSKDRLDDLNLVYRNLLILMWGLHDREGIFGPFANPATWPANGFLDEHFQQTRMRLWDPYESGTIGTGRPPFHDWIRRMNSWLRSGSRVIVRRAALSGHEALGKHNTLEEDQPAALRTIGDTAYEYVVRSTKKGHVVSAAAGRTVYPRERFRDSYYMKQNFDVPLDEEHSGYSERGYLQWICLDMIEASDIDHYLESRADRPSYMEYYGILLDVREQLRAEAPRIEPIIAKLEAAYDAAPVPLPEGLSRRDLARQAIRLWRTSNRGAMPPAAGEEGHATAYKTMLASMWTLAGNDHPVAAVEALCAEQGREPLRLVLTGKDRFAIYATSAGDEIEERPFGHVWVTRLACQRKSGVLKVSSIKVVEMPDAVADEEILKEWDGLAAWKGRSVPEKLNEQRYYEDSREPYTYECIRKALGMVESASLDDFIKLPENLELALQRMNALRRTRTKHGMVAEINIVVPFALIATTDFKAIPVPGFAARYEYERVANDYHMLALQDDPYRMLYRLCETDEDRDLVVRAYVSQYARKDIKQPEFLQSVHRAPTLGTHRLPSVARMPENPIGRDRQWKNIPLNANWSESIRQFDVSRRPQGGQTLIAPTSDELVRWMNPQAPAVLNEMCRRFGWEAVPFVPSSNW